MMQADVRRTHGWLTRLAPALAGAAIGLGAAASSHAQVLPTPPTPQPTAPAASPEKQPLNPPGSDKKGLADRPNFGTDQDAGSVDIWTEARWVLEKELEIVKGLNSLTGESITTWRHDVERQQPIKQTFTQSYAIQKPNKLYIDSRDITAFVDGKTVTVYSKVLHQYVQRPLPEMWRLRETLEKLSSGQIRSIPGEAMLRPGMSLEQTLRGIRSVERMRNGDFQGENGLWVSGTAVDDRQPGSQPYTFDRFYADSDHMIRGVNQNMTAMYQDMAERIAAENSEGLEQAQKAPKYLNVGTSTTYKRELNPKIPDTRFVFTPGPDDKQVEQLVYLIHPGVKDQIAMIGKPAPAEALVGKDFDDKPVDIPAMKGKVVVLDFWATWCGPCCASLPSMQAIKEKYADKPFVLIGMNREHIGDERKVKPFLARRGLTIQQFNDMDYRLPDTKDALGEVVQGAVAPGKAATAFFTTNSIPCVVIIDQDGNVADIENGYLPGKEKELMAKLDRLFSGKPIRTPEELEALRQQVQHADAMMKAHPLPPVQP